MSELKAEKQRLTDVAFKIFAVIGFLSSIITIYVWLTSSAASLSTITTPKRVEVPFALQLSKFAKENYDLDSAINDLSQKYCNPVSVDYDGSKSRNYFYSQQKCDAQKGLYSAIRDLVALDGKPLIAYDLKIINDGTAVADNIKIRSPIDVQVSAQDGSGNPVKVATLQDGRLFSIPALNPKESTQLRLLSTTPIKEEFEKDDSAPEVTFSGGNPSARSNIYVSGRYAQIVKFLDDLPLFLQIVFVGAGAFIITLIWLVPVSLISERATKAATVGKAATADVS